MNEIVIQEKFVEFSYLKCLCFKKKNGDLFGAVYFYLGGNNP